MVNAQATKSQQLQGNGEEAVLFFEFLALTLKLQSPSVAAAAVSELAGSGFLGASLERLISIVLF